jgi:DNA-binding NarL/FixJ family response regulator
MVSLSTKTIKLYVAEEVELYREIYSSIFIQQGNIDLLDITDNKDLAAVTRALKELNPDVILLGTRKLDNVTIAELEQIRAGFPRMGIVLMLMIYDVNNLQMLKGLVTQGGSGMAVFMKQSLERVEQVSGIIESVGEGHVILDPALTSLLLAEKQGHPFLRGFTRRELELLSLLASGYTNSAIAETLCIDIKTVQRHINNMYSKLRADINYSHKHLRVSAARLYLETTGELLASDTARCSTMP